MKKQGKEQFVYITEKLYLDKGAYSGKKKIISITMGGKEIPFRQTDEYGRFEFLSTSKVKE